jgi:NADH-quinone oxidoreductase subunit N
MLLSAVGMGMMVSAVDLMTLYIGLELSSLSSYVLASFLRATPARAKRGSSISFSARSPPVSSFTV